MATVSFHNFETVALLSRIQGSDYLALQRWMLKRHPNKGKIWLYRKYYRQIGLKRWQFFTTVKNHDHTKRYLNLAFASKVSIRRHVKVKGKANPYNPQFSKYFEERDQGKKTRKTKGNVDNYRLHTTIADRAVKKTAL